MKHLVVSVHGIRTFGAWQERLERLLVEEGGDHQLTIINYKLGYFSVVGFITVFFRWLVVRRFRLFFSEFTAGESWDRIDLVGHSFGTHVIAWALYAIPAKDRPSINTIVLAGSVLKSSFPWQVLIGHGVRRLVNDCGTEDGILILNQIAVLFTGMAGRMGFNGGLSRVFRNRFFEFGHSGYFLTDGRPDDAFMRRYWVPLLISDVDPEIVDVRKSSALSGVELMLLNNAEPIKLAAYATPFIVIALVYLTLYYSAETARREAVKQTTEAKRQNAVALHSHSEAQLLIAAQFLEAGDRDRAAAAALTGLPLDLDNPKQRPVVPGLIDVLDAAMSEPTPQRIVPYAADAMAVDRQGKLVALGLRDGTLQLWDLVTGAKLTSMASGHKNVATLDFSPDGRLLVSTGGDNIARVWRTSDLGPGVPFEVKTDAMLRNAWLVAGGARAFALAEDGTLALWETETGQVVEQWQTHTLTPAQPGTPQREPSPVLATAVSGDGNYLVTGGSDGSVKIWSAPEAKLVKTISAHPGWVITVAIDTHGQTLVTAGDDQVTRIWKLGAEPQPPPIEIKPTSAPVWFQIGPDQQTLLLANMSGDVKLIDLTNGHTLRRLPEQSGDTRILRFSPDGLRLLTSSTADPAVRIWATNDLSLQATLRFDDAPQKDVVFASNDRVVSWAPDFLASWTLDGRDTRKPLIAASSKLEATPVLDVNGDGSLIAGQLGLDIVLWDTKQVGRKPTSLVGHRRPVYNLRFSPDEKHLVTAGRDGFSILWNTESGRREQVFRHEDVVQDARVLTRGQRVLTSSRDGSAVIWNSADGKPLATMLGKTMFSDVDISPDEETVIGRADLDDLLIWRASDGVLLRKIVTSEMVSKLAAMPDNHSVAVGFKSGKITIYPFAVGTAPVTLFEHRGDFASISFSGDRRRMLTVSEDGLAAVWDSQSLLLISSFQTRVKNIAGGELDADGRRAYVVGEDGTVLVWRPDTNVVLRRVSVGDIPRPWRAVSLWDQDRILVVVGQTGIGHSVGISTLGGELSKISAAFHLSAPQALLNYARVQVSRPVPPAPADLSLGKEDEDADDCDRLAGHVYDPGKKAHGVIAGQIDGKLAEVACRKAIERKPHEARYHYQLGRALVREQHYDEALAEFRTSIAGGYSMAYLGRYALFQVGHDAATTDHQALDFLRAAFGQENGIAGYLLAEEYWLGKRVTEDKNEAMQLYLKAAMLGYPDAHLKLAEIYESGQIVPRDFERALYHQIAGVDHLEKLGLSNPSLSLRRASLARLVTPSAVLSAFGMPRGTLR